MCDVQDDDTTFMRDPKAKKARVSDEAASSIATKVQ